MIINNFRKNNPMLRIKFLLLSILLILSAAMALSVLAEEDENSVNDLSVTGLTITPTKPEAGQTSIIKATVRTIRKDTALSTGVSSYLTNSGIFRFQLNYPQHQYYQHRPRYHVHIQAFFQTQA
jgi:hypothetical protein